MRLWGFLLCTLAAANGSALTACPISSNESSAQSPPLQASPAIDRPALSVEFRRTSKFPTCLSNERIRIDPTGEVFRVRNTEECDDPAALWSTPYPTTPIRTLSPSAHRRLAELIATGGFFELPDFSTNPVVMDGSIQEIEADLDGRRHTVVMDNTDHPTFAAVRRTLYSFAH